MGYLWLHFEELETTVNFSKVKTKEISHNSLWEIMHFMYKSILKTLYSQILG